jgi:hypothetical protein
VNASINCDDTGACTCKPRVIGAKCSHCQNGTFNLANDNPYGCTRCMCSGITENCTSSTLYRSKVRCLVHCEFCDLFTMFCMWWTRLKWSNRSSTSSKSSTHNINVTTRFDVWSNMSFVGNQCGRPLLKISIVKLLLLVDDVIQYPHWSLYWSNKYFILGLIDKIWAEGMESDSWFWWTWKSNCYEYSGMILNL